MFLNLACALGPFALKWCSLVAVVGLAPSRHRLTHYYSILDTSVFSYFAHQRRYIMHSYICTKQLLLTHTHVRRTSCQVFINPGPINLPIQNGGTFECPSVDFLKPLDFIRQIYGGHWTSFSPLLSDARSWEKYAFNMHTTTHKIT